MAFVHVPYTVQQAKSDTVNAALREVISCRRRAIALTRLRDAANEGAFDRALLDDKKSYRRRW